MVKYTAVFEQAEDGSWGGYFPDLSAILVNGATLAEAQENAQTGLQLWVEDMREQGLALPDAATRAVTFEVAA